MRNVIEAIYERGVFRPLEPVSLPEGEHVQVTVPEPHTVKQRRLAALDAFNAACDELTEEQGRLFDEAIGRHLWFASQDGENLFRGSSRNG